MGDTTAPIDPVTGLPSYYSSFGGPLNSVSGGPLPLEQAKAQGQARIQQQQSMKRNQQSDLTLLEQEAGLASETNSPASQKLASSIAALQSLKRAGTTMLIVAGVIGLALAALLIWPAVVAIKQSKALSRYDASANAPNVANQPATGAAKTIAILTAILGGLGLLSAIVGLVGGQIVSGFGALFAVAMLVVGSVAFHRLTAKNETDIATDKKRGTWSHAASGLWIAAVVLALILPALGAIVAGSVLASL